MNYRERMLATIRGEPTDEIPWAPRMDLWIISLRARGKLPKRFIGLNTVEVSEVLDVACHAVGADFTLPHARDIRLRALGIDNHPDFPYRIELRDFPIESSDDGQDLRTLIHTLAGDIFTHLHRDAEMARRGISLPFVRSFAIESIDDFEPVAQIFEHLEVIPTPEGYAAFRKRVGERGLAVARGPVGASPIHLILHELVSPEQFFYLYHDQPEALHELAQRMEPLFGAWLDALIGCEAEVVFWGANYDQDLTWPPFFQKEIVPWLQKVSDRLHAAGKLLLTHTDGENLGLLPYYSSCRFDVGESVCPAPMTQCTLAEIRAGMGPNTTVWGGIPSVALLEDSMDDAIFERYLDQVFAELGGGDHLIFGVSDNVPPDASLDRLERIKERIEAFGPVEPRGPKV